MRNKTLLRLASLVIILLAFSHSLLAQTKTVTGRVSDDQGRGLQGITVTVKGTNTATQTDNNGAFTIVAPENGTLVFTSVGYTAREASIQGRNTVDVSMVTQTAALQEIVVIGYGTARRKDVTGAVGSVSAKDFNKGIQTAPDQLIQGKVAGVQVVNNSGAPGGATTVRIRGNSSVRTGSQPLYVIDGVPLDGRTARPSVDVGSGLNQTPNANPLNFISTSDIASIDILKDASATAIYGSRGANGVVIITTKKGQSGTPRIDVSASAGISNVLKEYDVLNGDEYRKAIQDYGLPATNNFGGNEDAFDAITRTAFTQNYNVAIGGGNDNGRYRLSAGFLDQEGVVEKTGFKKYSVNLTSSYKFLENKKLSIDFNVLASHNTEEIAPISNNAGFEGSLIGHALQWNPTRPLRKANDSLDILYGSTTVNPLAMSEAYDDKADVTGILASISPAYKLTNDLEYRLLYSINRSVGVRKTQIASFINLPDIEGKGLAVDADNELTTQLFTQTLSYNKQLNTSLGLNAVLGYEYQKFDFKGSTTKARGFQAGFIPYTNYLQNSSQDSRDISSFADPISKLQSFFGRVSGNFRDRYLLTATLRADGSSKFGENNRYGYFPSFAAAWNIANEEFFNSSFFDNLKLRLGWGQTGNQEFPAGSAQERYGFSQGAIFQDNVANPDLQWENSTTYNAGIDFSVMQGRLTGSLDYFNKTTKDLLFNFNAIQPAPAVKYWINLDGEVVNKGWEVALNGLLVRNANIAWNLGVNASFLDNELKNYNGPTVLTGEISGQGVSGATVQRLENGQPLNAFYVREFLGIDKTTGKSTYTDDGNSFHFIGDPNPDVLLGISTDFSYRKLTVTVNMNGAFGHEIYNNTLNSVIPISNLNGGRNIASSLVGGDVKESLTNALTTSSRYLEKGNYLKLGNATLSYNIGNLGNTLRNFNVFLTGQNLFIITDYEGFDPEVNTDKARDGVPSFGIEYIPYPTARSFLLGVNFSL